MVNYCAKWLLLSIFIILTVLGHWKAQEHIVVALYMKYMVASADDVAGIPHTYWPINSDIFLFVDVSNTVQLILLRCKTNNCWCSIDTHVQDRVGSISLSLVPVKAGNILFMTVCNLLPPWVPMIHDQHSLMLCWFSFSGCCWASVLVHFEDECYQSINNKQSRTNVNILCVTVPYLNGMIHSASLTNVTILFQAYHHKIR
jgi:hypothetical protein